MTSPMASTLHAFPHLGGVDRGIVDDSENLLRVELLLADQQSDEDLREFEEVACSWFLFQVYAWQAAGWWLLLLTFLACRLFGSSSGTMTRRGIRWKADVTVTVTAHGLKR
jgi:hypothetical protein